MGKERLFNKSSSLFSLLERYTFWLFFILSITFITIPQYTLAIEEETRIPEGVSRARFKIISKPDYSEAYNGYGDRVPLNWLLFNDEQLNDWVTGNISREERVLEGSWVYGISEDWMLEMVLPLVQKKQSSNLVLKNGAPSNSDWIAILKNLQSETINGIGDIRLKAGYEMGTSTKWFVRGGMALNLPTGNGGTPRGIYPLASGNQIYDATIFLHINWFPLVRGFRNGLRFSQSSALKGEREGLNGLSNTFIKGNRLEFHYNWSFESSDLFYAFELHHLMQMESQLGGGANDQGFLDEGSLEIGWGNINQLESQVLELPWQIRLGYREPLRGERHLIAPSFQVDVQIYF